MKKCPFCAENIQQEAIKCRYCGEFLENGPQGRPVPWFYKTSTIVFAFLLTGPLVIPIIWLNKNYSVRKKIISTAVVLAAVSILVLFLYKTFQQVSAYYNELNSYFNY